MTFNLIYIYIVLTEAYDNFRKLERFDRQLYFGGRTLTLTCSLLRPLALSIFSEFITEIMSIFISRTFRTVLLETRFYTFSSPKNTCRHNIFRNILHTRTIRNDRIRGFFENEPPLRWKTNNRHAVVAVNFLGFVRVRFQRTNNGRRKTRVRPSEIREPLNNVCTIYYEKLS